MHISRAHQILEYNVAQQNNLCNTCTKIWSVCGFEDRRLTKRIVFHHRSAGFLCTTKCNGYVFWPERSVAVAPVDHRFILDGELLRG